MSSRRQLTVRQDSQARDPGMALQCGHTLTVHDVPRAHSIIAGARYLIDRAELQA